MNYKVNGKLHREDGPALEYDGIQEWYLNGKLHREDGPAFINPGISEEWYMNGERHREDGPAMIEPNGNKDWFIHGKRHREDGAAREYHNDWKEWYLNGIRYSEEDWLVRINQRVININISGHSGSDKYTIARYLAELFKQKQFNVTNEYNEDVFDSKIDHISNKVNINISTTQLSRDKL